MESSFNTVELRELRGSGARRGPSPTPTSAPWTAATLGCSARGFENASYEQDEEQDLHQQEQQPTSYPPSTSGNSKVSVVGFGGCGRHLFWMFLKQLLKTVLM